MLFRARHRGARLDNLEEEVRAPEGARFLGYLADLSCLVACIFAVVRCARVKTRATQEV